jgi:hypothetical protein
MLRGYKKRWLILDGEILYFFANKERALAAIDNRMSSQLAFEDASEVDPKASMVEITRPDGKKKKVKGGLIALRVAQVDFLEHKKKTIAIETGTQKISFKFDSPEIKAEWVVAFKESIHWMNQHSHASSNLSGKHLFKHMSEDSEEDEHPFTLDEEQRKDLKEALSLAFGSNVIKENSKLTKYLADCWQTQAALEESLLALREYYIKSGDEDLRKIGEGIESNAQDLKQNVTTAVQQIEKTKNIVRDILMEQDKKIDTILNDKKY